MKKDILEAIEPRCEYKSNPIGIDGPNPRLSWKVYSPLKDVMQIVYRIRVKLKDEVVWDTGKVNSEESIHIKYEGKPLISCSLYEYAIKIWDNKGNISEWSDPAFFETGILSEREWQALWIVPDFEEDISKPSPCPMLRKEFDVKKKVESARAYITCHGLYEVSVNGNKITDALFTPGWTRYDKWIQYQTYDITDALTERKNCIGLILGDGWYRGYLAWEGKRNTYGEKLAAFVQILIRYTDGTEEYVCSDETWKSSTGPILMSDIYLGEKYDARLDMPGWDTADFFDKDWHGVTIKNDVSAKLTAQVNEPVRIVEEITPKELMKTPSGETVIDMGQNMTGWIKVRAKGPVGSKIVIHHAEVLDEKGNFYTKNLRFAHQMDTYILKGEGEAFFQPHFTFHGFRYVKIIEYPGTPSINDFTGMVIHSDMKKTGSFKCSDALINRLQNNILWSQRDNFLDVPTDCPQRNERLGWTGDAQVFIRTACFNMDSALFFTKWLKDLKAEQSDDGGVPFVVPNVLPANWRMLEEGSENDCSAAWGDAAVICPWNIYLCYGDKDILSEQYESMKAWVEYIRNQSPNHLWGKGSQLGDWLALDASEGSYLGATPNELVATAFYANSTEILSKVAAILGFDRDAQKYSELFQKIKKAYCKEFTTPEGRLKKETQTGYVLSLMFGLAESSHVGNFAHSLVNMIKEKGYHLDTGFVGTPYLCHVLSRHGYGGIACRLLMQKDFPSWLYQVEKGATTIWEHWDGIKEDGSFWSADMNSFNHYAYGSIGDWMYREIAGIDIDIERPGYKHILLKPNIGCGLDYCEGKLMSMYGLVRSRWEKKGRSVKIEIVIPPNTSATAFLPHAYQSSADSLTEDIEGIRSYKNVYGGAILQLGSGKYIFNYIADKSGKGTIS